MAKGKRVGSLAEVIGESLGLNNYKSEEENQMNKQVKLTANNETAVVTEVAGVVQVDRGGQVTPFKPEFTFESVVEKFKKYGWQVVEPEPTPEPEPEIKVVAAATGGVDPKVAESAFSQNITIGVQKATDSYLELQKQIAELKKEQDKYKESIRQYMDENDVTAIKGTYGQEVYLQPAKKSNSTSRYTDYEMEDVVPLLDEELVRQVTETRINAEKLDAFLKVSKLPKERKDAIKANKISVPGTPRFAVKK
ncbi:hypothetical protein HWC53_gp152 [Bacillus phage vB_BmeM-Goe8]|uniref:Uncharacterized protein n=1 Tax=Bacillus phage vB_BmeM-Goe8 TaxID=2593638 RepID=A0A516KMY4_9CAUD|nr:hypothetical protein HWC53_gp152 [Bacillus phage vB_BmeM-Goe8]QDP42937.1 hypothetical protein Goe8_c01640 [Bacillus phage vB_BmeM-Goe8]